MRSNHRPTWLDQVIGFVSPSAALKRIRARVATDVVVRHYEAAAAGRRTQGWRRSAGDANAVTGPVLSRLRTAARDLVRNNGHATKGVRAIANHVVGWGIVAKPLPANPRAAAAWKAWAETTACDSDGRHDFYGLQKLIMRTVIESGEVLVRRRLRFPEDGLPIPIQLQVLEPDYLDTDKNATFRDTTGRVQRRIVHGVEYDMLGRRTAYWLFPEHPGSEQFSSGTSMRVPAESVLHIYRVDRPGQVRGPSWFAPVLLKFKDFDDYSDATLMKQKIAACLAVITSDMDGSASPLGSVTDTDGIIDSLEPGMVLNVPPGKEVDVVNPPTVREYPEYASITLHEIAAGLGISYEDLTGDYSKVNFSSARLARISYWDDVTDWRWRMLIPQFCNPAFAWAMEAAEIMGLVTRPATGLPITAAWTAPPMPMIEPDKEGLAYKRNVRAGILTLSEAIRERGYDPEEFLKEYAADMARLDKLGLVLDSDARKTSDAGLTQARPRGTVNPDPAEFDDATALPTPAAPPAEGGGDAPKAPPSSADDEDEEAEEARARRRRHNEAVIVQEATLAGFNRGVIAGANAVIEARRRARTPKGNPGGTSAPSKE